MCWEREDEVVGTPDIQFTALGGGASIGASAHLVRIGGTSVLVDCGINPNVSPVVTFDHLCKRTRASGLVASLTDVSAVVLTHAHTDHVGLLPALFRRFREEDKRVPPFYASDSTRGLLPLVFENIMKFSSEVPYGEPDIATTLQHVRPPEEDGSIDWFYRDLGRLCLHPTSHLLGSTMVELEVEGRTVIHTGDLQLRETPTLNAARVPSTTPDLLIVDGTYAGSAPGRELRGWERTRQELFALLDQIVERRAVVLLPSFALGRTQDILALVLEYAESRSDADYYVYLDGQSSVVTQSIYPRFARELSQRYLELVARHRWRIKSVDRDIDLSRLIDTEIAGYPAVVIASSGMLLPDSASRRWAEALMRHQNNVLAFTGYVPEDVLEEVFDRNALGAVPGHSAWRQLGCSSHASISDTEDLVQRLGPGAVAVVHCGSGDLQARGSLLDGLARHDVWANVAHEGSVLTVSNKGAMVNGY